VALWNDDGARTKSVMVGNNLMLGLGQVKLSKVDPHSYVPWSKIQEGCKSFSVSWAS